MSQPPDKYERIFDFTDFSAMQPSAQQPGQKIDQELNLARESVNDTIDRLNEIQRDDGKIRSTALDTTEFTSIVNTATATATAAAASATTSASTATTQAGIATTAATNAGNSATSASGSAATATAQTAIASAAATTATTKATEASNSAASALASETSATASAATATTKAAEASGSAATATTQVSNALNSANTSAAQANLASASATAAGNSATSASASAISASASAVAAAASAASIDPSVYAVKANNLSDLADAPTARTNLGLGTMATATAADYSTTAQAAALYYPLSGNPSSFLVAADITGKANSANAALTGNVTITSNSAGAALFIEQAGVGNILTLHDQVTDTNFVTIDQNGKVSTIPSVATSAGFNVAHGTAPTSGQINGDIWTTTSGLFAWINGSSRQFATLSDGLTYSGNNTFAGPTLTFGNTTAASTVNIGTGATVSASTKTVNVATGGVVGSSTLTTIGPVLGASTTSVGNTTAASTLNLATGATLTATTKAVNLGTSGVAGSTTNIAIGSTTGTSTTTLNGITNGTTAAADTNSVALATTAFVVGQVSTTTPANNGTAAVGTSLKYARADHVHASDTTKAPLASPTFTGTPLSTTAAADTNTTQIATTAYVVGQASSTTPLADGTAAVGTSLRYARQDHVHPAAAVATVAQVNSPASNTLLMSPDKVRQMVMFPGFQQFLAGGATGTSGAGAGAPSTTTRLRQFVGPNAGTAGYATFVFDTNVSGQGFAGSKRGDATYGKNYARPFWMAGRTILGSSTGGLAGHADNLFRCELGGRNVIGSTGDPTHASLGWKVAGGGSQAIVFYARTRQAVNGGTYSQTTTSFTPVLAQWFDWMVTYDGASTCQMYVNDALVGSISVNFAGYQGEQYNHYTEQIEQTVTATTQFAVSHLPPRIYFSE